jgi:hypothetical protein
MFHSAELLTTANYIVVQLAVSLPVVWCQDMFTLVLARRHDVHM